MRGLDLQHIRAFVAVAKEGNLTRAAEKLHLTQPAVSVQLKNFQEELNLTLLVRTSKGLSLTSDGEEILPLAEKTLASIHQLRKHASLMQKCLGGRIALGTTMSPEITRLGSLLRELVTSYPRLRASLHHGMTGYIKSELLKEKLDAGYYVAAVGEELTPDFYSEHLADFTHFIVAPKGWRARVVNKDWEELAQLPWVWSHPQSVHSRILTERINKYGVIPNAVAHADAEASMLDMVHSGIGLALARQSVALRHSEKYGLVVLDAYPLKSSLYFICLSKRQHEPAISAVLQAIRVTFQR